MQAVLALLPAIGSAIAGGASAAASAGTALLSSGGALTAARIGTSALSALSSYSLATSQAASLSQQADVELMQGRQEFIQAQQKSNAILRDYQDVAGAQDVGAAAMGIDAASGSVRAAQGRAQSEADRQLAVIRSDAVMNAGLRRARAAYLQSAAGQTKQLGLLGALTDLGKGFIGLAQTGGQAKAA